MSEIAYLLSNPAMPGLLKIGRTDKGDMAQRMKSLYTTGVPVPFDCVYACVVENNEAVERALHKRFARQRLNPKREFFAIKAKTVVREMKRYELEDVTPSFREGFDSSLLDTEREARRQVRRKAERADPAVAEAKELHATIKRPRNRPAATAQPASAG
jgi:hypothetical protein